MYSVTNICISIYFDVFLYIIAIIRNIQIPKLLNSLLFLYYMKVTFRDPDTQTSYLVIRSSIINMSRELSVVEKKLLSSKVPKALGQGRKSYETKIEANDVLQKAGYEVYFKVDIPIDHKDKKAKLNVPVAYTSIRARAAIGVGVKAGTSIGAGAGIGTGVKAGTRIGAGSGILAGAGIGAGIGARAGAGTDIGTGPSIGAGPSIEAGIGRGLIVTKVDKCQV